MFGTALDLVAAPIRQTLTIRERDHRPWPLPRRPWLMGQTWINLLFAHWRVPEESLRRYVPDQLALDRFDGETWLGVTPFEVAALRFGFAPPLPGLSRFRELNVRTYVRVDGKPGIFFFSLDAASELAVSGARRFYKLPYFKAEMSIRRVGNEIAFTSARLGQGVHFTARYAPAALEAAPGDLADFLIERYCLYTVDHASRVWRAEIHHPRWPLQSAEAELKFGGLLAEGLAVDPKAALLHYSRRQDVLVWRLERVPQHQITT